MRDADVQHLIQGKVRVKPTDREESEAKGRDICDRTFAFAVRVVKLCRALESQGKSARTLGDQLLRSATSVGANMEEAQAAHSRADFLSKCTITLREARETLYWLRLFRAADVLPPDRLGSLLDESNQLVSILTTIVKKTKASAPGSLP